MQKITPNLWFDNQAEQAAQFYTALFDNATIKRTTRYTKAGFEIHGQPEGQVMTVEFTLAGQEFIALNGGPIFTFNPSVSFLVACETKAEVENLWEKLIEGGSALMELGEYPFSEKYGWLQDKFGLSWQLMYMGGETVKQKITPTLLFVGEQCGKTEEAIKTYVSIFHNSKIGSMLRYTVGEEPDKAGTIKHAAFTLESQEFAAMDSARQHDFTFNEAISFVIRCETQEEIDYYWEKLAADPTAGQCGWLKDKYGVSWQVSPIILDEMLQDKDAQKVERVTNAFLKMRKFDIKELQRAYKEDA